MHDFDIPGITPGRDIIVVGESFNINKHITGNNNSVSQEQPPYLQVINPSNFLSSSLLLFQSGRKAATAS